VEVEMRRIALLIVCVVCDNRNTILAQRAACPAIEVSVVADAPSDSNRFILATDGRSIRLTAEPLVTSADVTGAHASLTEGQYVLNVGVTVEAAKRVQLFSERNVGNTLAFLVDGRVLRTPKIRDPITGNGFLIGAFERAEAERLADAINNGCRR
jgi:preprotein translocase subunit SecD